MATEPNFMAMARDDIDPLTGMEGSLRQYDRTMWDKTSGVVKGLAKQAVKSVPNMAAALDASIGAAGAILESSASGARELTGFDSVFQPYENVGAAIKQWGVDNAQWIRKNILESDALSLPVELRGRLWDNPEFLLDPEWLAYNVGEVGSSYLPVIAAAITGGPVAGAFVGGLLEGSDLFRELVAEHNVPADKAASAALLFGSVTGYLNKIGAESALKAIGEKGIAGRLARYTGTGAVEAGTEYAEEPFQAAFSAWAQGKSLDEILADVQESLKNVDVIPGAFIAGSGGSIYTNFQEDQTKARQDQAKQMSDTLKAWMDIANTSNLRARDAKIFARFVNQVGTKQGVSEIRVPASEIQTFFQSQGIEHDPLAWLEGVGATDIENDYKQALETGGTVALPIGEVVAQFAEDEALQALRPHMTVDLEASTEQTVEVDTQGDVAQMVRLDELVQEQDARRLSQEKRAELVEKFTVAGVYSAEDAEQVATVWEGYANAAAELRGMTADEWVDKVGLKVVRDGVRGEGLEQSVYHGSPFRGIEQQNLKELAQGWKDTFGIDLFAYEKRGNITVEKIVVPESRRSQGVGTSFFKELFEYADRTGQTVSLTPSKDFGGSLPKLKKFYKNLGFVENKGRNKDYGISETLYRTPGRYNQDQSEARGSVQFGDVETIITLFKKADLSTLLHETGHIFLADMKQAASEGYGVEDWNTIRRWLGVGEDGVITTEQHEMFARTFEAYLREGKAPSLELQSAFFKFKRWLTNIYKSIIAYDTDLNDEVRGVFDRMLATEEQIAEARAVNAMVEAMGLAEVETISPDDADEYQDLATQVAQKAAEKLDGLKNRERNKRLRQWREEAIEWVDSQPVYAAIKYLTRGSGPRVPVEKAQDMKAKGASAQAILDATGWYETEKRHWRSKDNIGLGLDRDELVLAYGKDIIEKMPKAVPPLVRINGMHPDMAVADLRQFGTEYEYPDDLIEALINAKPRKDAIQEYIDAREAEHDGAIDTDEILHSEEYERLLELESKIWAKQGKGTAAKRKALKIWAEKQVAAGSVKSARDIHNLLIQARKARKAVLAAHKAGDHEQAFEASESLRKVEALISAKYKAREEVVAIEKRVKRLAKQKVMDDGYRQQIFALLQKYGLGSPGMVPRDPGNLEPLDRFIEGMSDDLSMADARPSFSDDILRGTAQPYKGLTMEQFREVDRVVRFLARMGSMAKGMALSRKGMEIADRAEKQAASMVGMRGKIVPEIGTFKRWITSIPRKYLPELQIIPYIMKAADNYKGLGTDSTTGLNEEMVQWLYDASSEEKRLWAEFGKELQPLLDHINKRVHEQSSKSKYVDNGIPVLNIMRGNGLGGWTPDMIWAAALNMGNDGNALAMIKGYQLVTADEIKKAMGETKTMTKAQFQEHAKNTTLRLGMARLGQFTASLTDEDWTVVEGIWELIDKAYPLINAEFERINGVPMSKVEARPFTVRGREVRGGYYPLQFDGRFTDKAKEFQEVEDWLKGAGMFQSAEARSGFANERVGGVMPPKLDLNVISTHLWDVLHYSTHAATLKDIRRIVENQTWKEQFGRVFGEEMRSQLLPWLKAVARPERGVSGELSSTFEKHRKLATIAILGLNVSVALKQPFSLFGAATEMGWPSTFQGIGTVLRHPKETIDQVNALSPYMAARGTAYDREVGEATRRAGYRKRSVWVGGKQYTSDDVHAFSMGLIRVMDAAAVYPIWIGAYNKAARTMEQADAIKYADRIVRDTQPSSDAVDLTAWQRGNGIYRLFAMFRTFTLKYGNRQRAYYKGWRAGEVSNKEYLRHALYEHLLPPVLMALLITTLRTGEPPEPEELALDTLGYWVCGVPGLSEAISTFKYHGTITDSPAFYGAEVFGKVLASGYKATQGEIDEKAMWALAEALAYKAGLPVAKVVKTFAEGVESDNPVNLFMTNPKR
jgi:GNAT superfamily N-acetyltransferase